MDFAMPADLQAYLDELDAFIEAEIKPLEDADDNIRFFDHRREHARTDWDNQGLPRHDWEAVAARRDAQGRCRGALALLGAEEIWRQGRIEPVDGGDPRAFRRQGAGAAQRSAERA